MSAREVELQQILLEAREQNTTLRAALDTRDKQLAAALGRVTALREAMEGIKYSATNPVGLCYDRSLVESMNDIAIEALAADDAAKESA